ncbi:diacylglycerol kinase family protein [Paenibacillus sp. Marseille-Q4541]|uniref:diacylglycerol/lipid kinase family protein n=1 Tax=Paenibacillus sp. Marseille-Q4541 TaxID=2831522 RepID=UPI001BABE1D4|nr:diacylglycerol kinase family protein [Paenibacillus sp. Marseille-Q4541]
MKQAMIIINPSSGKEEALEYVRQVEDILHEKGYEVTVNETAKALDATEFCMTACKECYDLVVSIGGDGTLHETINGLIDQDHRPILGVIPLGTVNDFARALDIPLDPEKAIQTLTSSAVKTVDMGKMNDRLFANVVAAGSLAESLSSVSSEDKSKLGAFAYLKEGIKELMSNPSHPFTITYDGETWVGESPLFLAALTNSVGGFEKLVPDASVDDGLIHCFIVKNINVFNTITVGTSLLFGSLKDHKDVVYFTAKNVHVSSSEQILTNVDGEDGPPLPLELRILPAHIQVIVPEEDS